MANLGEFLSLMSRECGDFPPDSMLAREWTQNRYASVLERAPWMFLTREDTVETAAEITAGTAQVTLNSASVDEATADANGWSVAVEGRYFRRNGDSELYLISTFTEDGGVGGTDRLTLERNYEGSTSTSAGYHIVQRIYSLAADVRDVISMQAIDSPRPLLLVSQTDLDLAVPNRPTRSWPPIWWAYAGRDSSDNVRVEIYPIPDEAHGILYHYIQETPSLADADTVILPQVNYSLLRAGWLADYYSWRYAHTNAKPDALAASQKFEAEFEKRLQEMLLREARSLPPKKLRMASRFIRHRGKDKFRTTLGVTLPDD